MQVYKFGGASVKDADAISNVKKTLQNCPENLVVVISAMAKTTNNLEHLVKEYFNGKDWRKAFEDVKSFHRVVINELFVEEHSGSKEKLMHHFEALETKLNSECSLNFNFEYDQIVSFGEIFSTAIISEYLNSQGIHNQWLDARKLLRTDSNFREAAVNWDLSGALFQKSVTFSGNKIYITQGFIGSDNNNLTTTLGREGSDFTAAAIAYMLDATSITIWKDVPGVLNADPKYFSDTVKLDQISYLDAIELAYFGTSVIHPKTIQPIQRKDIPLFVKSFLAPSEAGTIIRNIQTENKIACYIVKKNQRFLHIATRDFSFIVETHLKEIFSVFATFGLRMNLMQNSAVSFDVCVNNDETRVPGVIAALDKKFDITDESGLELITIRHYNDQVIDQMLKGRELVLQQKTKNNIQLVTRNVDV